MDRGVGRRSSSELTLYGTLNIALRENPDLETLLRTLFFAGKPVLYLTRYSPATGDAKNTSVLTDPRGGSHEVILIASGSEVSLAADEHEKLVAEGVRSRIVSIAPQDAFDQQTGQYPRESATNLCDSACRNRASQGLRSHSEFEPNHMVAAANEF
jgi:transketolase